MYVANAKRLTLAGAEKMVETAIAGATKEGLAISVVVADSGGNLVLAKRMDGGRFHTIHSSTTKAVTAASNKRPTTSKGAVAQDLDVAHAIGLALAAYWSLAGYLLGVSFALSRRRRTRCAAGLL